MDVMKRIVALYEKSPLTMAEIGTRMGYINPDVARTSVWQFLNDTRDPRISMVIRFMNAIGRPMSDLFPVETSKPGQIRFRHTFHGRR